MAKKRTKAEIFSMWFVRILYKSKFSFWQVIKEANTTGRCDMVAAAVWWLLFTSVRMCELESH